MSSNWTSPAEGILEITPSDSADNTTGSRGILCETGGDAKVTTKAGNTVTIPLQQGYNPIQIVRLWSTGLTASGLFALY